MSLLLASSCGGQRLSQFSGSWDQWNICASRSYQDNLLAPFVKMLSLALEALCSYWTVIQIKEQSMQFSVSQSSFQDQNQLVSGQHYFLEKLSSSSLNSCLWRSQQKIVYNENRTQESRVCGSSGSSTWATGLRFGHTHSFFFKLAITCRDFRESWASP